MKKNGFFEGAIVATLGIVIVKIIGLIYVIPFNAIIGEQGGALYGYGYNIYMLFLSISSAGFPFAISKMTSEYLALNDSGAVVKTYKIAKKFIMIISLIAFLILFIFANPIAHFIIGSQTGGNSYSDIAFVIRMVSFAILIVPFLSVTKGFLQGHKYITPTSVSQIIEQIVRVAVILLGSYLALNVFNLGLKNAVGISVFAAFVGGFFAFVYLRIKIKKNNLLDKEKDTTKTTNKEIMNKLIKYSIPFIIISIIYNLYGTTDMILISRTMNDILHIDGNVTESVISIFTTWGTKINNILLAITGGLTTSLIPNVVTSYTKGDKKDLDNKFNKAIKCVLLVVVPLTIFLSLLSDSFWTLFYGQSTYGPAVYKVMVYYALFGGTYSIIVNILQGINKYKLVIVGILMGLMFNVIFDVPFIILFNNLGLIPCWGAVVAGCLGYSISMSMILFVLNIKYNFNYKETIVKLPSYIFSWIIFVMVILVTKMFIPTNLTNRLLQIPILGIFGILSFGIYALINYLNGNITDLFDFKRGKKYENRNS